MHGVSIPLESLKLGVLLDPNLLLDKEVATRARDSFHQLWLVSQQWPFLGKKDLVIVVHALVTTTSMCAT